MNEEEIRSIMEHNDAFYEGMDWSTECSEVGCILSQLIDIGHRFEHDLYPKLLSQNDNMLPYGEVVSKRMCIDAVAKMMSAVAGYAQALGELDMTRFRQWMDEHPDDDNDDD